MFSDIQPNDGYGELEGERKCGFERVRVLRVGRGMYDEREGRWFGRLAQMKRQLAPPEGTAWNAKTDCATLAGRTLSVTQLTTTLGRQRSRVSTFTEGNLQLL